MLILTRTVGQSLIIDGNIKITVLETKGETIKVGVDAPKEVVVNRQEVQIKIEKEHACGRGKNCIATTTVANKDGGTGKV
jgi:carbon storage regulator